MRRSLPLAIATLALLPAAAPAATVSGKVAGGTGYTILAMAASGQSSSARIAANGKFSLKLPGASATLQLIKPNGAYFGPVVLGKAGHKAIVRLSKRGGKLGRIALKAGFGSARAPKKAVSRSGAVVAGKGGAPLGAGRLGLVKLKGGHAKARIAAAGGSNAPGTDQDGDGIPSAFDADDNGNGTLDGVDPQTAKASGAGLFSDVSVMMSRAINANAGGLSTAAVDNFIKNNLSLNFYLDSFATHGATVSAVDVDCGTLAYCRPGDGTALMGDGGNSPTGVQNQPWISYDNNHDGYPDVPLNANGGGSVIHSIEVRPNVTTADIHPGDLFQVRYTTPGGVLTVPTALSLFFASTPALASYDGGAGTVPVTYPVSDSAPGSDQNPLRLSGDKLTMSFWRPQRAGLGGEPAFMDMGHLRYGVSIAGNNRELQCGSSYYSATSPTLAGGAGTKDSVFNALFPLQDTAGDAAPSPANVLKLSFDLGGCLRANNVDASQPIRLALTAVDESRPGGTDRTSLTLAACLPGCTPPSQGPGPQNGDGGTQQQGGGTQTQGGKPDLAVDSVTGVTNSGNCDLTITIANRGTATAPPSTTGVAVGGGASTTYQAQSVDAGGHVEVAGTISGPCAGQNLTVTADAPNAVDEFAEDNNIWQGTL